MEEKNLSVSFFLIFCLPNAFLYLRKSVKSVDGTEGKNLEATKAFCSEFPFPCFPDSFKSAESAARINRSARRSSKQDRQSAANSRAAGR